MTNAITSDFLSSITPGWVVMFLDSPRTVFTLHSWLDLLSVVLAFWISILKVFKSLQNIWHRLSGITSFEKRLESSSGHTTSFCPNMVQYRFKFNLLNSELNYQQLWMVILLNPGSEFNGGFKILSYIAFLCPFCKLAGWLVVLRIYVASAVFQPYRDLKSGDNQSLKIRVARPGIEPRSSCSASQKLNHSATAATIL